MFNAFIFDLDNTLVNTTSLEQFRGSANVGNGSQNYRQTLLAACKKISAPHLISLDNLKQLKIKNPSAKFCVITRSPKAYAGVVLSEFYPGFQWDAVVGYEDVKHTKPDPEGVVKALTDAGVDGGMLTNSFLIIGDEESDIICGYRAGLSTILYSASQLTASKSTQFRANALLPDASVRLERTLIEAIDDLASRLPILEAFLAGKNPESIRAPRLRHFCPLESEKTGANPHPRVSVVTLGRMFSEYESLEFRRGGHLLTEQIHAHKNSTEFPDEWIQALVSVIDKQIADSSHYLSSVLGKTPISITCIPHKPGRLPRLEALLSHLENKYSSRQGGRIKRGFNPSLLAYGSGAKSHHGEHLKRQARFENVRDNLVVADPAQVPGKIVVVIDDVVTSGASLYYAEKYLLGAGAKEVICIALAQAIGDSTS